MRRGTPSESRRNVIRRCESLRNVIRCCERTALFHSVISRGRANNGKLLDFAALMISCE